MNVIYTVHYTVATYEGDIQVVTDTDADSDYIKAKARRLLKQRCGGVGLPFGAESWKITNKRECTE